MASGIGDPADPRSPEAGLPSLICVEYPGVVQNVDTMIATLGGLNTIAEVVEEPNRRLELRFRPDDISCKPTCGERTVDTGMILKVKRWKRKKKPHPPPNPSLQPADSGVSDPTEEYKYDVKVMGSVDVKFKFSNLCDFQYLPMRKARNGSGYESIYESVFFDKLVDSAWLSQDSPLFLPPAAFSRMDVPQDYQFRREAAADKTSLDTPYNIIGRTRQRRSHHAIFITYDMDEVPQRARDFAANQLKVKFISHGDQDVVIQRFEEQPVWSKNALHAITGIMPDRLKYILPAIAYYFTTGPWRNQWVRFGYDPRKVVEAAQFQTMDYRVRLHAGARHRVKAKRSYANYLLPYKAMNWSKPKTSLIDRDSFSNIVVTGDGKGKESTPPISVTNVANERSEADKDAKADVYIFRKGRIPPYRQMFYQFKDLLLEEAQQVIQSSLKPGPNPKCDERNGWFVPGTDQRLRDILTKAINEGAFGEFSDHASQNIVWLPYLGGLISIIFSHWLFGTVLPIILVWIILQDWSRFLLPLRKVIFSNITEPCEDALDVNPAFACEPDSETVGWVNNILERFWTNSLRPFALDDVSKIVERDLFHGFLNKLRLFRHFNVHAFLIHFDPGEIPPILTFIRCSTSEVNLLNHGYESLTFDLGLAVDLHPKVETWIGGSMKFGLKRFRLAAPLIFRFSPMLKDFKLVGQLEISLKRQIAMDWEFQYLLRCLNLTFVKRIVHAILHILGSFVIQPRKLIFPMLVDPKVICDHLQMQRIPIALLRVEIEKGKSLKVSKDLHDKEELKFVVKDFDWGFCHEDDDLGFMNLDLCAILDQEGVEKWINLHSGTLTYDRTIGPQFCKEVSRIQSQNNVRTEWERQVA
ncbi:hypothetical protein TCAL_08702 [Tigriopus californicus]|uniref:General transcription factor 3C polypeptide 5 n=1 Tax=Tigriopus californicus TaxID=6832 RepID=A0A553NG20_TIGCA|nr:hypothetical protein TCAL_08702 [Tigriopus californicus]